MVKLLVGQGLVEVFVQMNLEVFLSDVELPFTHVAFMLPVLVADVSAFRSCSDVRAIDSENLHAIQEKQPVV